MEKAKRMIERGVDAGEQLLAIIQGLEQEGYTKAQINSALKEFGLKI